MFAANKPPVRHFVAMIMEANVLHRFLRRCVTIPHLHKKKKGVNKDVSLRVSG